jgi:DNA polymerase-1
MKGKLLCIDLNAIFCRSRAALTRTMGEMTTSAGIPVTGTFGTLNTIFSILEKDTYQCVIPCFDAGGNFRKKENNQYKANREKSDIGFYADLSLLKEEVLPTLGFTPIGMKGFEADDIIAHISRNSPAYDEIHILSVDTDLLQLVGNRVKVILFNSAKKVQTFGIDEVVEKFGVFPSEIKYLKALSGDSSDNVAGIPKVGPKTAVKIIEESRPKGEDEFLSGADRIAFHPKVKEQAATFFANLRLVTLEHDVPDLVWFASDVPIPMHVEALFEGLEFRQMLKRKVKILEVLGCS